MLDVGPLNAKGYVGIERMSDGLIEETRREFRTFPKHGRFIRGQTRKRERRAYFRNPNANQPEVTAEDDLLMRRFGRSSYAAIEEIAFRRVRRYEQKDLDDKPDSVVIRGTEKIQ